MSKLFKGNTNYDNQEDVFDDTDDVFAPQPKIVCESKEDIIDNEYEPHVRKIEETSDKVEERAQTKKEQKSNYEVVFYVRYNLDQGEKPTEEEVTKYFNKYGEIDHVKSPYNRDYYFIFFNKLNTEASHRRTKTVMYQIIGEMGDRPFYINVARPYKKRSYRNGNRRRDRRQRDMIIMDPYRKFNSRNENRSSEWEERNASYNSQMNYNKYFSHDRRDFDSYDNERISSQRRERYNRRNQQMHNEDNFDTYEKEPMRRFFVNRNSGSKGNRRNQTRSSREGKYKDETKDVSTSNPNKYKNRQSRSEIEKK